MRVVPSVIWFLLAHAVYVHIALLHIELPLMHPIHRPWLQPCSQIDRYSQDIERFTPDTLSPDPTAQKTEMNSSIS